MTGVIKTKRTSLTVTLPAIEATSGVGFLTRYAQTCTCEQNVFFFFKSIHRYASTFQCDFTFKGQENRLIFLGQENRLIFLKLFQIVL